MTSGEQINKKHIRHGADREVSKLMIDYWSNMEQKIYRIDDAFLGHVEALTVADDSEGQ
jgi:hypothetical protein